MVTFPEILITRRCIDDTLRAIKIIRMTATKDANSRGRKIHELWFMSEWIIVAYAEPEFNETKRVFWTFEIKSKTYGKLDLRLLHFLIQQKERSVTDVYNLVTAFL